MTSAATTTLPTPDLFPPANRAGESNLLRAWLVVRDAVPLITGNVRGPRLTIAAGLAALVDALDIKPRYAQALLDRGNGKWWNLDVKHGYIYPYSAAHILQRLGGVATDAPPVAIPVATLASLKACNAFCYAAYLSRYVKQKRIDGQVETVATPVSRAALMARFGVTRNTLRRWEKAAGVIVLNNYACARPAEFHALPDRPFEFHCACGRIFASNHQEEFETHRLGATPCTADFLIVWRRPNSYLPPAPARTADLPRTSPTCRARFTRYQARRAAVLRATKCPSAVQTARPPTHEHTQAYDWLAAGPRPTYRLPGKSDPLPPVLLRCVPRARLWIGGHA